MVSYASALMRRFLDSIHLPLSLRMTIGSVVLTSYISMGAIIAFSVRPISSAFYLFCCLVPERKSWWLVSMSVGDMGTRCVLLKAFWVIIVDDSLKPSHVSTRTEFMWLLITLHYLCDFLACYGVIRVRLGF